MLRMRTRLLPVTDITSGRCIAKLPVVHAHDMHIKTVHFLKISKTTWTKSYFLISPYIIPNYLNEDTWVVYEYGQSHICGATGSHMTGSDVTGSHVTGRDITGRDHVRTGSMSCACTTGSFRTHILLMYLHLNNWELCRVKSENMTLFMLSLIF
jgi:hypothetical protein